MCNGGTEVQALFLKERGKIFLKKGGNTTLQGTNISQIPVEAIPAARDHSAPHSWGWEDRSLIQGVLGASQGPGAL